MDEELKDSDSSDRGIDADADLEDENKNKDQDEGRSQVAHGVEFGTDIYKGKSLDEMDLDLES